jgi:cytidine deaminase
MKLWKHNIPPRAKLERRTQLGPWKKLNPKPLGAALGTGVPRSGNLFGILSRGLVNLGGMEKARLIEMAVEVARRIPLRSDFSAGAVGAALLAEDGRTYTGICLNLACGIGFCAEHAAVAEMLKNGATRVKMIVAASKDKVLPPCGRCRELLAQLHPENLNCEVVLGEDRAVPLQALLPEHWL